MNPETSHRFTDARYWAADRSSGGYNEFGEVLLSPPVQIRIRFEDKQGQMLDPRGNVVKVDARAVVDREIPVGSEIWLGTEDGWYGQGSGSGNDSEVMRVIAYSECQDVKGHVARRVIGLRKSKAVIGDLS